MDQKQNDTLSITLRFGSWTLPMTVRRQDEEIYRQAEKLIKERYSFYTNNYRNQSTEMYLVMTVLDVAVMLKQKETSMDATPIVNRLAPLLEELESALNEKQEQ
ncbi:MAG: cell division protein ZapA [Bacteroidaceae bacterium]|jgi:cell division protein ZapA|nr:cell division protein ZapA [Bacteroidaceae bacterium]MBQ2459942.1 cell division protein ZapA [Bacteroidaceae bacterium]MBQ3958778.1 cell division protein ZapA [Bacteroidaceae bacterium]MBQ3991904.1 cell division protein ZapA [Bacteroidaceae bacterium]